MQTQNNFINTLLQLRNNNKISKLEAIVILKSLKHENNKIYNFLMAKIQTMLIPPENVLKLLAEVKGNEPLWEKSYKLFQDGNVQCALWLKSVEPLEFDFESLINDIQLDGLEKMYKLQCDAIKYSPMSASEKEKANAKVFQEYANAMIEINNDLRKKIEEQEKLKKEKNPFYSTLPEMMSDVERARAIGVVNYTKPKN